LQASSIGTWLVWAALFRRDPHRRVCSRRERDEAALRPAAGKPQSEAVGAAIAEYRRLSPDKLAVSGEVNRMIAAAINADPRWFWEGPDV
jgi:hypothetical protein